MSERTPSGVDGQRAGVRVKSRDCGKLSIMGGRPSGTVTFLFTDVEGSTRLWAADAAAMSSSLLVHDSILREAIEAGGGYVFTTAPSQFP